MRDGPANWRPFIDRRQRAVLSVTNAPADAQTVCCRRKAPEPDTTSRTSSDGQPTEMLRLNQKLGSKKFYLNFYTQGDSDVISFHIYASWFSPPSCG